MKEYNLSGKILIAVEVPEGATDFNVFDKADRKSWTDTHEMSTPCLQYFRDGCWHFPKQLPHGSYSILARGKDMTNKDWEKIVGEGVALSSSSFIWADHENKKAFKRSATESGLSWLRSQGISPDCLLLLKK